MKLLNNLILTLSALTLSLSAFAATPQTKFTPTECGINTLESTGVVNVAAICFGEASVDGQAAFSAVQAQLTDGTLMTYEIDDVEYDSSTQKRIYVYHNDSELFELTVIYTNRHDVEIPLEVSGKLDVGTGFKAKLTPVD